MGNSEDFIEMLANEPVEHEEARKPDWRGIDFSEELNNMVSRSANGFDCPLESYILVSGMIKTFENAKKALLNDALIAFENEAGTAKTVEMYGAKISANQKRTFYFNEIPEIQEVKNHLKVLKQRATDAYNTDGTVIDDSTGEVIMPAYAKSSKKSLTIKF